MAVDLHGGAGGRSSQRKKKSRREANFGDANARQSKKLKSERGMAKKLIIKKNKKHQTIRSRKDPAPMDSSPWFKLFLAAESGA
jgi:hypothetical protein